MVVQIKYHCLGDVIEWKWSSDNKLLPAPFWTSCFLIDGLLIDSGAPGGEDDLKKFLLSLDEERMPKKCVITHSHEDHCGGAAMLQSEFKIPIYASKKAIPLLKKEKNYPDYRRITWGFPYRPFEAKPIENSISTSSNRYKFDIIEIPGHAMEEIALLEKAQEWAIIADGIMPKYTMIFGKATDIPEDISQIYESLKKIDKITKNMDKLIIFTAGRGIFKNRAIIQEKIAEIEILHKMTFQYRKEAEDKGYADKRLLRYIVRKLFKKESFVGKLTRGGLSNQNLIISLLKWPLEKK
jgi:glyoxylase-like metal-dependent hydrolase (beta-lactamase superfamily II)